MNQPASEPQTAKKPKARVVAFYLPQFHPIPENDEWWGKGFTEWTNTGKAQKLFKGHYQPRVPADLGYYDLRLPEVREAQAEMARYAGVEGFAYWHYWWAGKRLIERPFQEVLKSGKPDLPFSLAWANETWSGVWLGNPGKILMEQTYPGPKDYEAHFYALLDAFQDPRYMRVEDKPIFTIYKPFKIPDAKAYINQWNELAVKNGLKGIHFIGATGAASTEADEILRMGFDAVNTNGSYEARCAIEGRVLQIAKLKLMEKVGGVLLNRYKYKDIINHFFTKLDKESNIYPSILPQWDNSPRSGRRSIIYTESTPSLFKKHVAEAVNLVTHKEEDRKIIFLKSWNEWAEGNYVEPDMKFGYGYLDALKAVLL